MNCPVHERVLFPNSVADRGVVVVVCPERKMFHRCSLGGACTDIVNGNFYVAKKLGDFESLLPRVGISQTE
jgi:hypothetical protein